MKFYKILSIILFMLFSLQVQATSTPEKTIQKVSEEVFNILKINPEIKNDELKLKKIIDHKLMPHVDHKYISFKILGRYLKKDKKNEIKYFINTMKPYVSNTFLASLKFYEQQEYKISTNKTSSKKIKKVNMKILEPNKKDIMLTFLLRQDKKTKSWKVFDIVAEGISLLNSKQKEFAPLLKKHGIRGTADIIKEKTK